MNKINYCASCGTPIRRENGVWVHYRHMDHKPLPKTEWVTPAPVNIGEPRNIARHVPVDKARIRPDSYYIDKGDGTSFSVPSNLFWMVFLACGVVALIGVDAGELWGLFAFVLFIIMYALFRYKA